MYHIFQCIRNSNKSDMSEIVIFKYVENSVISEIYLIGVNVLVMQE